MRSGTEQRYIFKIHSERLREAKWNLCLPISEARQNEELISLADSQVLRWIDELTGNTDADQKAAAIKAEIRGLRKLDNGCKNRNRIKKLYEELDQIQLRPDYMFLVIDKKKDYLRASKGFTINGVKFKRLLGTNGGIKNSTIVFINEELYDEVARRIENDRDQTVPLVTAKLEAYKALVCSASTPVSFPNGILVVDDCTTEFNTDYLYLTDDTDDNQPHLSIVTGSIPGGRVESTTVRQNISDGFGLMSPALAERWSSDLRLGYTASGVNTRFSFEKGMVYTFDFHEFADSVAGTHIVKDAWGNDVDIREVELVLTTSMVKLWDSYESCDAYLEASLRNGYSFAVPKACPESLESYRNLNYQYIQSYDLDDSDIEELIAPTMNEIRAVLSGDWTKTILFLKGFGLNERNILRQEDDFAKGLMIDNRLINDPYVQASIYNLISHRIQEAKLGVLKVHGNFSMASGDPFALCQSIFGLEVTGLLKAGEIYNSFWCETPEVCVFRSPMTWHGNILKMNPANSDEVRHWYQHMKTCTIFNAWDTAMQRLNGMDFDGDLVMLTDNPVLLRRHVDQPALICAQRKAEKRISTEEDFIQSNMDSFGNDIGKTTNWVTSMFEVQAKYPKGSREYEELDFRIKCGQLYQQNAIND